MADAFDELVEAPQAAPAKPKTVPNEWAQRTAPADDLDVPHVVKPVKAPRKPLNLPKLPAFKLPKISDKTLFIGAGAIAALAVGAVAAHFMLNREVVPEAAPVSAQVQPQEQVVEQPQQPVESAAPQEPAQVVAPTETAQPPASVPPIPAEAAAAPAKVAKPKPRPQQDEKARLDAQLQRILRNTQ